VTLGERPSGIKSDKLDELAKFENIKFE